MRLKLPLVHKFKQANSSCLCYLILFFIFVSFISKAYSIYNESSSARLAALRDNTERLNNDFENALKKVVLLHYAKSEEKNFAHNEIINLEIFDPEYDVVSGNKILPIRLLTKDINNNIISLESKINLKALIKELFYSLDEKISFLLLDKSQNILVASASSSALTQDEMLRVESVSVLDQPLILDNSSFYYVKKLKHYPFTLLTGYSNNYILSEHFKDSLVVLLILMLSIFASVLIFKKMKTDFN